MLSHIFHVSWQMACHLILYLADIVFGVDWCYVYFSVWTDDMPIKNGHNFCVWTDVIKNGHNFCVWTDVMSILMDITSVQTLK